VSTAIVRPLGPDEIAGAAAVLGVAFADNPSTLANVRGDRSRAIRMMERTVRAVKLGTRYSNVLVAEQHGEIVGVLNAAPWPHCQMSTIDKLKTIPKMIHAAGPALPGVSKMASARAKHDPAEPHWHIGPVGVHPGHQGHGVGTALLDAFLQQVREQGIPSFLETDVDKNVTFYEQSGFVVVGTEHIQGIHTRFMLRAAGPHR
jgi:GNAT superfamily N-acetyltransferase